MGEVLQLRQPSRKLGHDDVILVPRESNADVARDVLARPSAHTESMLRAACIWLRDNGDWVDRERARHLLARLDHEAAIEAQWVANARQRAVIGLIFVVCVVAISLFDLAWGQSLAAGVVR